MFNRGKAVTTFIISLLLAGTACASPQLEGGGIIGGTAVAAIADTAQTENYGPPPQYAVPAPPSVVVIPGTYVYVVPDSRVPILFYHGIWWRPFEGRWYRSNYYNGPWFYVRPRGVPRVLITMPPDYYYRVPPGSPWIPFLELRGNWERWERERHWDRHEERRDEHRDRDRERHSDYR